MSELMHIHIGKPLKKVKGKTDILIKFFCHVLLHMTYIVENNCPLQRKTGQKKFIIITWTLSTEKMSKLLEVRFLITKINITLVIDHHRNC